MKNVFAIITALLMSAVVASATTLTFITTNGTSIATNTFTITAPTGASLASLTFITTNGTVISTNTFTTAQIEAAYYANGVGYTYGASGGHIGFYGTYPIVEPSSTPSAATAVTYSNQLATAATATTAILSNQGVGAVTSSTSVLSNGLQSFTFMVCTNSGSGNNMGTNYTTSLPTNWVVGTAITTVTPVTAMTNVVVGTPVVSISAQNCATNQVIASTSVSLVNAIRTALVNLGLMK